jgi:hypothetical protein
MWLYPCPCSTILMMIMFAFPRNACYTCEYACTHIHTNTRPTRTQTHTHTHIHTHTHTHWHRNCTTTRCLLLNDGMRNLKIFFMIILDDFGNPKNVYVHIHAYCVLHVCAYVCRVRFCKYACMHGMCARYFCQKTPLVSFGKQKFTIIIMPIMPPIFFPCMLPNETGHVI